MQTDLAHELFHVLTWEAMPPAHAEDTRYPAKERVEQLADHFASALLMPTASLEPLDGCSELPERALIGRLNRTAAELGVTAGALKWRLVALGRLARARAQAIEDSRLRNNGRRAPSRDQPPLFSKRFVALIARAIGEGRISVRRAAGLLGLGIDDFPELFAAHGVAAGIGLSEGRLPP